MSILLTILGGVAVLLGSGLLLLSAVGMLRVTDLYLRCHVAGKAATLGVLLVLLGVAVLLGEAGAVVRVLLAAGFLIATVPLATQLLTRAAMAGRVEMDPATADYTRGQTIGRTDEGAGLPLRRPR